ncbi:elongation factor P 5-aminopentanone reductase [Bacillus sp. PS06]|uniref:elongation factor P 5-aminopentanone reductase n=1 Tax=Bacillus sp. PS06 TaxID=2764176 RepID=UPI00177FC543|nr:SDR family oxidoreductase [Bacillus sp. PS06]MBD8068234.1 SDR family oxidoreductase [Bacillus sp. PS06]
MEKYALITGASGGIGMSIAKILYEQGYSLYLHYSKNDYELREFVARTNNKNIHIVQADLSKPGGVSDLLEQITHPITTIINNAGNSYFGLVTDMTEAEVNEMITLHTTSPFMLIKSLLPNMVSNKQGNIIMITSIWGLIGASCEVLYSMVKGSQNSFVKALAKEVSLSGIRVNAIAPGAIDTQMLNLFTEDDKTALKEEIPMGRLGKPEEIAEVVGFLCSDKASYMTGQVLSVNGGWHC